MICPNCGANIPNGTEFCKHCGKPTQFSKQMKYCPDLPPQKPLDTLDTGRGQPVNQPPWPNELQHLQERVSELPTRAQIRTDIRRAAAVVLIITAFCLLLCCLFCVLMCRYALRSSLPPEPVSTTEPAAATETPATNTPVATAMPTVTPTPVAVATSEPDYDDSISRPGRHLTTVITSASAQTSPSAGSNP